MSQEETQRPAGLRGPAARTGHRARPSALPAADDQGARPPPRGRRRAHARDGARRTRHNVVSTAVPQIVGDLGGFSVFSWLFSGYLLAVTVTLPGLRKLSDTFGRKPVLVSGIGLFLIGSLLCALAWNMAAADRLPRSSRASAAAPSRGPSRPSPPTSTR